MLNTVKLNNIRIGERFRTTSLAGVKQHRVLFSFDYDIVPDDPAADPDEVLHFHWNRAAYATSAPEATEESTSTLEFWGTSLQAVVMQFVTACILGHSVLSEIAGALGPEIMKRINADWPPPHRSDDKSAPKTWRYVDFK